MKMRSTNESVGSRSCRDARWSAFLLFRWMAALAFGLIGPLGAQSGRLFREQSDKQPVVLGEAWLVPLGGAPAKFPDIQAAVDAASEGDTVSLTDGLFRGPRNRDVRISGKNVRIESVSGPERCVINCEAKGRGFLFEGSDVGPATMLRGVTIRRGVGLNLGGGGGLLVWSGSSATIEDCRIVDCSSGLGGGIAYYVSGSSLGIIRDCVVTGCSSGQEGGGMRCFNVLIEGCTIVENTAGGGQGGGVFLRANSVIRNSIVARNSTNHPIFNNGGGGLLARDLARIESCTIVDNTARHGGGISTAFGPGVVVSNSILWGNRALDPSRGDQVHSSLALGIPDIVLRYCDIEGGAAGLGGSAGFPAPVFELIATLDVDPEFTDRSSGDYHLRASSPLIGAGDPELALQPFEGDHDGEPRANGALDMGADEHYAGLALAYPSPLVAGMINTLSARGVGPGALVLFWVGFVPGSVPMGIGICPGLTLDIADGSLVGAAIMDGSGEAEVRTFAPLSLAGSMLLMQATAIELPVSAPTCTASNLVPFGFP